jgi:hypothetical protein
LSLCPIILKLFEANLWYSKVGNKRLCELAKSRGGVRPIDWREKQRIRGRCDRPNQRVGWTREKESINGKTTTEI